MLKRPYSMGDFGVVITLNMKWTTIVKIVITIKGNFHTNSAHLQKTQLWRSFVYHALKIVAKQLRQVQGAELMIQ